MRAQLTGIVAAAIVTLLLAAPGVARATSGEDSVTGNSISAESCHAVFCLRTIRTYDARTSERDGATGTVTETIVIRSRFGEVRHVFVAPVTCLTLHGPRATVGADFTEAPFPFDLLDPGWLLFVEDGSPDREATTVVAQPPSTCRPLAPVPLIPIAEGELVVHDARRPPTTREQCRRGGWRQYGFPSRRACIRYVEGRSRPPGAVASGGARGG